MRHRFVALTFVAACGLADTPGPEKARPGQKAVGSKSPPPSPAQADPTTGSREDVPEPLAVAAEPEPEPEPPDPSRGEIQAGDSLSRVLRRSGLDPQTSYRLTTALAKVTDPSALRSGQSYRVDLDEEGGFREFALELSATKHAMVEAEADGGMRARIEAIPTDTNTVEIGLRIDTSLWVAMISAGIEPSLVDRIADVFAYDVNFFTDTRKGDTIRLIVEREEVDGGFVGWGRVLAAEYAGGVGTHRVFRFQPTKGEWRYVNDAGEGVSRTLVKTPLKFARVSSSFNPKRMHPILHRVKGHNGVDYAAPEGTPVWASADGKIVFRGERGGAGNMVILAHPGGMRTLYMHLSRFRDGQRVGDRVRAKTVIGYVGQTGLATGPHLHYGLTVGGRYVDPQTVKKHRGPGVARADRGRWKRERSELAKHLNRIETRTGSDQPD